MREIYSRKKVNKTFFKTWLLELGDLHIFWFYKVRENFFVTPSFTAFIRPGIVVMAATTNVLVVIQTAGSPQNSSAWPRRLLSKIKKYANRLCLKSMNLCQYSYKFLVSMLMQMCRKAYFRWRFHLVSVICIYGFSKSINLS